jgi:hypothetical protein
VKIVGLGKYAALRQVDEEFIDDFPPKLQTKTEPSIKYRTTFEICQTRSI